MQVHGHGARAVAQIPDAEDAVRMGRGRDGRHVVHGPRAVVHMRQQQDGGAIIQRARDFLGLEQHQLQAVLLADRLGDVQIGGEVAALGQQLPARRTVFGRDPRRGREHLEQVDRGGVGEHQLVLARAQPGRELVAQAQRQVDPAGLVPGGDQVLRPFLLDDLGHARRRGLRRRSQRIAVEVDLARGQGEQVAQWAQRVLGVAFAAVLQSGCHGALVSIRGWQAARAERRAPAMHRLA
ncbi:hypothetical protein D3C78_886920 [compost metagenome]